ncbi:class I tRNA ligase family protein, partial [Brevibacterium paucivorans]
WCCRNPLIYKGVSSWFVSVTEFKDRMLANNELINWVPDNVKHGQFGKWLENARDWSITRNRFWGPAFRDVICHGIVLGSDGNK